MAPVNGCHEISPGEWIEKLRNKIKINTMKMHAWKEEIITKKEMERSLRINN
jgi:hypothetical protein